MGAVTICRNGYVEDLERRLRDTEKLLAQYSAEREHSAMMAGAYKAERNALVRCLSHLRATDWFKETDDTGRHVICGLDSEATRRALTNLTP